MRHAPSRTRNPPDIATTTLKTTSARHSMSIARTSARLSEAMVKAARKSAKASTARIVHLPLGSSLPERPFLDRDAPHHQHAKRQRRERAADARAARQRDRRQLQDDGHVVRVAQIGVGTAGDLGCARHDDDAKRPRRAERQNRPPLQALWPPRTAPARAIARRTSGAARLRAGARSPRRSSRETRPGRRRASPSTRRRAARCRPGCAARARCAPRAAPRRASARRQRPG